MKHQIRIGTRGWDHTSWHGQFYPQQLQQTEWLNHYSANFGCVEVDESFTQLPQKSTVKDWLSQTDKSFHMCLRIPRAITHEKKLKHCETQLTNLFTRMKDFDTRLGPFIFQLPHRWRCNVARLQGLLNSLPDDFRYAFEFHDDTWYCPAVIDLLRRHHSAYVINELPMGRTDTLATTDFSVLRVPSPADNTTRNLHPQTLRAWANRCLNLSRKNGDVYLIFEDHGDGKSLHNAQHVKSYLSPPEY